MRWLVRCVLIMILVACGTPTRYVTIDGRDTDGSIIDPINLRNDYQTPTRTTGTVRHGERVRFIQQDGAGCEIETAARIRGWLTCANFIQEFKRR